MKTADIIMFLLTVSVILLIMHISCLYFLVHSFNYIRNHGAIFKLLFIAMAFAAPYAMFWARTHGGPSGRIIEVCAMAWLGVIFIFFSVALCMTLFEFIFRLIAPGVDVHRNFGFMGVIFTLLFAGSAFYSALKTPDVKVVDLTIKNLPKELDGFKLVQLTDMHLSASLPYGLLERTVKEVQNLNPDMVVLTGDLVDKGFDYKEKAQTLLSSLKPKYGKYSVMGNHEFYTGIEFSKNFMEKSGFVILRGGNLKIADNFYVAGIDDIKSAKIKPAGVKKAFEGIDKNSAVIYLSHQPLLADEAAQNGAGLMLSGHTHRGQIFPFNFVVGFTYKYVYGLYDVDGMNLYVSSGTHYWGPPMRLFLPSEIVLFNLKTDKK